MERTIVEQDFIGGQEPLTKEEELAISKYLSDKKVKKDASPTRTTKKKEKMG